MEFFFIVALLSVMEVSLSFDNAAMNATVLRKMDRYWQGIFLTWGILISVFLIRLVLPAVIVSASSHMGMLEVGKLAFQNPVEYGRQITRSHDIIAAFGGSFLMMVYLNFLMDSEKETHWFPWIERFIATNSPENIAEKYVVISFLVLLASLIVMPPMIPVLVGIVTFIMLDLFKQSVETFNISKGLGAFIYLEVLDASFSLDGVIGAFAISSNIIAIMIGLGIGSVVIRSLTVYMVRKKALEAFTYLEHGALYSIGVLGLLMFLSTRMEIPQLFVGTIGITFITSSIITSIRRPHGSV